MKVVLIVVAIFIGAFALWTVSDNEDAKICQAKYGSSYHLYHQPANSSIKSCVGPNGEVKTL